MEKSQNILHEDEKFIYDMMDDVLNNAKQKIKSNIQNYTNSLKSNMEQTIRKVMDEKLFDIKNTIDELKSEMGEIKSKTDSIYTIIEQLKNSIPKNGFVSTNVEPPKRIDNQNDYKKKEEQNLIKNYVEKENKEEKEEKINPNPIISDDDEDEIKLKFVKKRMDKIIDIKEANFFNVDNIAITNISEKPLIKLRFVRDSENSTKDINIYANSKKMDELYFYMSSELPSKSTDKNIIVPLQITNPKPDKSYKIILYIREGVKERNISEPLEITVKIKKSEDPEQQKKIKASKIYEEIKNEYPNHEKLINKNDIINKLLKNNLSKEEIKKEISAKIKENEEKEKEEKAESVYKKLNLDNLNIDKQKIIELIIQKKFNIKEVQNWINQKIEEQNKEKAGKIYNKLSQLKEVDFSKASKEDILNDIIELKFKEDEIKKKYKKQEEKEEGGDEDDEEKVKEIAKDLEDNYELSSFVDEDVIHAKIRELNYDMEKIKEWADDVLINGGA